MARFAPTPVRLRPFALRLCALALGASLACELEDHEEHFACIYDYSTYSVSEYGTNFDEHPDNCTDVESQAQCDAITESSNDCSDGFCSEWTYSNVSLVPGTCAELMGEG